MLLEYPRQNKKIDKDFIANVNIDVYNMFPQPSKSSSGGVAICAKKKVDHFKRADLCILDDDFESAWIKIRNKKGKNFLCGCFYRQPNTDTSRFVKHIETISSKINKTKYNIFVMGAFNIDLLQYESHNNTNEFLNTIISHSFLP